MLLPEIPVGGRLSLFLKEWTKITNDQWVLSIIKEGYKLEFQQFPPKTGVKITSVPAKDLEILHLEVKELMEKSAVEYVPQADILNGFYSTFFLVPKKTGDMRPVINLKPLNRYLRKQHFKMDSLSTVLNVVKQGDWAISLDLKDAYMHIPVFSKTQTVSEVLCKKQPLLTIFSSTVWSNISSSSFYQSSIGSSCTFTSTRHQTSSIPGRLVSSKSIISHVSPGSRDSVESSGKVGFHNQSKKILFNSNTENNIYIGALFHLDLGMVMPTQERVLKLLKTVKVMNLKKHATARDFLHLLGIMASCIEMIPYARLHMRPIQIYLLSHWRPTSQNLELNVPITQYLKSHLIWWSDTANITKGRSLQHWETHVTITTTDASTSNGWGGHMDSQIVQGTWSDIQKTQHINCLELEAVLKTIQHFLPQLKGKNVLLRCDNSTVVQYINKQGGTKSIQLCQKNLGFVETLNRTQNSDKSSTYSRQSECVSRSSITDKNKTHRVVSSGDCSSTNFCQSNI
ncbi:Hypothetical predicted protein [Mytilus galloprovincialis]|uniref:Reverse transcriptase domain-containing protein n=1 Tax=Mytilus galloprovincialis TaxID=29158 RepID=A0A8B6GAJ9_MYTGA|nr:Hypothetical predicted protein [Mytilus galloprovincialis]